MNAVIYKELIKNEIELSLFSNFNRYQEVKKCWRKENEEWVLKDIMFIEKWGSEEYKYLVECLKNTIETGGTVYGAFENKKLVGFASLEKQFFGSKKEYLQLSSIHTSYDKRGKGIGKKLFALVCEKAKEMSAKKLYISAHSSQETQSFYKSMGCVEAVEYNESLVDKEPYDCQLEYRLF
ncbi:GNAT family N-acetyltransferase [Clostridium sp. D2Q-14]|uniref:GNAT family N-acetyltransferase n=1 Tax=Anaeromonas gelatinilytica TaxID=2683194 RepID=UPI00193B036D|nr:GNAT family N-acetyltransferase [Anaeromonas gelatinilytica]MBS4535729.1 GNAT family N-acetyltransferase [Anaeromonas gelatinilytica]